MNKDERFPAQYESAWKELIKGIEETSATAALEERVKLPKRFGSEKKLVFKLISVKNILIVILASMIVGAGVWLFTGSTFKKESTTFVEQVQELATLATAQAHVKVILEQEDNKLFGKDIQVDLPGTKRELLLVVPATVTAGVDLKELTSDDIKIDENEKEIEIVLPHAGFIQEPSIQMDKVRTFSDEGLLRGETKWDEGFDLAAEAQNQIKAESIEIGLLQTAEQNAEKVLKEFFGTLGYSVKISYK